MKIKIPFTDRVYYIGKKEVEAVKQRLNYGFYQNFVSGGLGTRVSLDSLYNFYNNIVDIKQSIKKIQNATAKAGYKIVNKENPKKQPDIQQTEILKNFIDHPRMPFNKIKNLWIRDRFIAGNYFGFIERDLKNNPILLNEVDPRTMSIIADKYGNIIKYIQRVGGESSVDFNKEEIIHSVMDVSTKNPLLGISPIEAIVIEAQTELNAQTSNYVFYENNAVPSHLMIIDGELTMEQYKELKKEIDEKFKGAKNQFKSGIIPFVKDIKTITPSQKDMQYLETRKFTTKKIVVAFGVDSFILGYTEGVQRGNADVIYKEFYENTIKPEENALEEMINLDLLPKLGLDKITFVINQSSYENIKEVTDVSRMDVIVGIMTINEARAKRGLEPSENEFANELLFNGILIDDLGAEASAAMQEIQKAYKLKSEKYINLLEK